MDSPLDPFLATFLQYVQEGPSGYVPGPQAKRCAEQLGLQVSFVEALYVSARMRGLLKPAYGGAGKLQWQVSTEGAALIERYRPDPTRPAQEDTTPAPLSSEAAES